MRRLLVSVAFLAALLIAPSAALALGPSGQRRRARRHEPAAGRSRGRTSPLGVTYHVFRADAGLRHEPDVPCDTASDRCRPGSRQLHRHHGDLAGQLLLFRARPMTASTDRGLGPCSRSSSTRRRRSITVDADRRKRLSCRITVSATATDNLTSITMTADGIAYTPGTLSRQHGAPFASVNTTFIATDAAGNPPITAVVDRDRPRSGPAACARPGDHHRSGAAEGDAQLGLRHG